MGKNETTSQTASQKSKLANFKGNIHTLTEEDRKKGRSTVTKKKALANSFNSIKTGKFSKRIPKCNTCPIKDQCEFYDFREPKAVCKCLDIPGYREVVQALKLQDEEDLSTVINKQMQKIYLKDLTTNDRASIRDFVLMLLKIQESKFKRTQQNTVNIQINNFHNEFTIFKDTTLKILKKHPKIMQEWRDAIESAKQSD
jgi:adenine-specific DNA glycosylase